jgi:hypothetical protein
LKHVLTSSWSSLLTRLTITSVWGRRVGEIGLAFGLVPTYLAFAVLKRTVAIESLAYWAWRPAVGSRDRMREARFIASVLRVSWMFGRRDGDCLQRALVLYRGLSRLGASPTLSIGVQLTDTFRGHAWVEVDGRPVADPLAARGDFVSMLKFGTGGAPLVDSRAEPVV